VHTQTIEGFWSIFKRGIVGSSTKSARNISRSMSLSSSFAIIIASMTTFLERRLKDAESAPIYFGSSCCSGCDLDS
jgi:hypothetical protein